MNDITKLEPTQLWIQFAKVCSIPHPSKHEAQLRNYIISRATALGHDHQVDAAGNLVVRKAATAGHESAPTVILQAHMDMVPQKNSDKKFNFETDPIETYIDGDWVKARGTTLGADNGIGVATMLSLLEASSEVEHPALELLFTADEETGLNGANGLATDMLQGDILINLDSEDEGELYVGCAGAVNVTADFTYKEESTPGGMTAYEIALSGLKGGHSGLEIVLQRGNASKLLGRFLYENPEVRLSSIDAGGLRNAIPREARAVVVVQSGMVADFEAKVVAFEAKLQREYQRVESAISFVATKFETIPSIVVECDFQIRFVEALIAVPNGVMRMSDSVPGLVETSTSLSRVEVGNGEAAMQFMVRCMANYGKPQVVAMIRSVISLAGGRVVAQGDYDGWAPNPDSKILATMSASYKKLYGAEPEIKAIHAGLECGIIGGKYPALDMISIGPTMRSPHSPDERVNIPTVAKFYEFLLYTLRSL